MKRKKKIKNIPKHNCNISKKEKKWSKMKFEEKSKSKHIPICILYMNNQATLLQAWYNSSLELNKRTKITKSDVVKLRRNMAKTCNKSPKNLPTLSIYFVPYLKSAREHIVWNISTKFFKGNAFFSRLCPFSFPKHFPMTGKQINNYNTAWRE